MEIFSKAVKRKNKLNIIQLKNDNKTLSADYLISYIENPKKSTHIQILIRTNKQV